MGLQRRLRSHSERELLAPWCVCVCVCVCLLGFYVKIQQLLKRKPNITHLRIMHCFQTWGSCRPTLRSSVGVNDRTVNARCWCCHVFVFVFAMTGRFGRKGTGKTWWIPQWQWQTNSCVARRFLCRHVLARSVLYSSVRAICRR